MTNFAYIDSISGDKLYKPCNLYRQDLKKSNIGQKTKGKLEKPIFNKGDLIAKYEMKYETYPSGYKSVVSVNGIHIVSDKCAYACKHCGAIYQSKNIACRSLFPTDDPKSGLVCSNEAGHDLVRICECEPIIR